MSWGPHPAVRRVHSRGVWFMDTFTSPRAGGAINTSHCYPFSTGDRVTDLIQGGPFPKGPGCSFNNRLGVAGRKGRARWIWEGCGLQGRRRRLIRRRTDGRTDGVDAGRSAGAEERQLRPESHEGTWAPLLRRVVRVSAVGCGLCPRGGKCRVLMESQAISGQRGKTPGDCSSRPRVLSWARPHRGTCSGQTTEEQGPSPAQCPLTTSAPRQSPRAGAQPYQAALWGAGGT